MKLLHITWMASTVIVVIIKLLSITGTATAVTSLKSNMPEGEACIGEYVTFTCTATSFSLRWIVRAQSSTKQLFLHSDQALGTTINVRDSGLELRFELVSFTVNPVNLTSILVARATAVLDRGTIKCRATSTETLPFRILYGFPGSPMNIEINDKMYGIDSSNVTLIWMPPVVAKRLAHYRIELMSSETAAKELIVNTSHVNVKDIPYNQETTVSISAVNDCSGEGMQLNFSFIIHGCNNPVTPANAVLHNISDHESVSSMSVAVIAPGEMVTFACKYYASELYVHICQESGLWYPDPSAVSCPNKCQIPILNSSLVEIEVINSAAVQLQGSAFTLRCKEGFTPTRPQLGIIVCSSNGTWIPDPDDYECHDQSKKDGNCGSTSCLGLYAAIGVSAGVLICGLCCGVALASVKKWISWKAHAINRQSTCHYEDTCGPVYDTITPTYEKVHDACQLSSKETDTAEMTDNAAYTMNSKFCQD